MIGLTKSESLCIVITAFISGTLSISGSSIIIHKTLSSNQNKRLGTVHKRILFGMSTMDVFQSISAALSTFPVPKDSLGAYFAYGNTTTCTFQGFLGIIGYSCMMYNLMLSIHYVAKIRFLMSESQERRIIEPYMHLLAIGLPMILAIYLFCTESFNYVGTKCWIGTYPYGCIEDPDTDCTRGINVSNIKICVGSFQLVLITLVAINMGIVFWRVRHQEKVLQKRLAMSRRRSSLHGSVDPEGCLENNVEQEVLREECKMTKKTRAVAMQGLFYVLAFVGTILPAIVFRAVEQFHQMMLFPFIFIATLTFPLQGFFNYLVYIRPQVLSIRRRDPTISLVKAVQIATFTTEEDM